MVSIETNFEVQIVNSIMVARADTNPVYVERTFNTLMDCFDVEFGVMIYRIDDQEHKIPADAPVPIESPQHEYRITHCAGRLTETRLRA